MRFEGGVGYIATCAENGKQVVLVAAERKGGTMTFVKPCGIVCAPIDFTFGREFARVTLSDGHYTVSSAVKADVGEAKRIVDMVKEGAKA